MRKARTRRKTGKNKQWQQGRRTEVDELEAFLEKGLYMALS